jgi:hypothetical protein
MTNIPRWWLNPGGALTGEYHSGTGTWEIARVAKRWKIKIRFTSLTGYEQGLSTSLFLSGAQPPYLIYDYLGDPDEYKYIEFERR